MHPSALTGEPALITKAFPFFLKSKFMAIKQPAKKAATSPKSKTPAAKTTLKKDKYVYNFGAGKGDGDDGGLDHDATPSRMPSMARSASAASYRRCRMISDCRAISRTRRSALRARASQYPGV